MKPDEQTAIRIIQETIPKKVKSIERFNTGLDNYVYKIIFEDNTNLVVRLNTPDKLDQYKSAIYWHEKLNPVNIPLPKIYASNTKQGTIPYLIMEYIDGKDLGEVYEDLNSSQRKRIAEDIAHIQNQVASTLPHGEGFGFTNSYNEKNLYKDWYSVLNNHLNRSKEWIESVGFVDSQVVERVRDKLDKYKEYFDSIQPIPFLHDTTTKNVLVSCGNIVGIVDIDSICFGDPLFVPALTNMSLLSKGYETDYINYWLNAVKATNYQHLVVKFYTAMFCVNFLGEIGQNFNQAPQKIHSAKNYQLKEKLEKILNELLAG